MVTTIVEPVFVDTNNLIYAQQALSPFNAQATAFGPDTIIQRQPGNRPIRPVDRVGDRRKC